MATPHRNRSLLRTCLAPIIATALVALLASTGLTGRLDRAWLDLMQRTFAAQATVPEDTALVLIDESSLQHMGGEQHAMRWPWPRTAFAALYAGLHHAGATRVVADFIFFENGDPMDDTVLGAVGAGLPELTLGARYDPRTGETHIPVVWSEEMRQSHPELFANRPRWGLVNSLPDDDSVIRRYRCGSSLVESALGQPFDAEAAAHPTPTLMRWRGNLGALRARGVPVLAAWPFVEHGLALIDRATEAATDLDPAGLGTAIDAQPLDDADLEFVRGRTVFVGVNAAGTFDAIATPCGAPEPGVITHWTAWANFADDSFLQEAGPTVSWAVLLAVVASVAWAGRHGIGLRRPGVAAGLGALAIVGSSVAAFLLGTWFAPTVPSFGAAAVFSAVAVESFRLERARKREIQGWFGSYVSPAVVRQLVADPDSLKLGGERRELTVYFSDLAGFTTLSEGMPPDQLVGLVNAFLEELTECVIAEGCYLDKYIGDAIMAVFGSPEVLENHALAACRAALASQRTLASLNDRLERDHGVRLGMRIGINTGDMIVGNVGSPKKRNYTVLGDAVNLASRLESANKQFDTSILIGPVTAQRVAGALVTRPIAHVRVKGKARAVEVHELVGEPATIDQPTTAFLASYGEGYAAFAARRFADAVRAFEIAVAARPHDPCARHYLDEARRLAAETPPPDWEPTWNLETK